MKLKPHQTLVGFTASRYSTDVDGIGDDTFELSAGTLAAATDVVAGFHLVSTPASAWADPEKLDFSNVSGYRQGRELVKDVLQNKAAKAAFAEKFVKLWPTLDRDGRNSVKELLSNLDLKVAGITTHHKDKRAIASVL